MSTGAIRKPGQRILNPNMYCRVRDLAKAMPAPKLGPSEDGCINLILSLVLVDTETLIRFASATQY